MRGIKKESLGRIFFVAAAFFCFLPSGFAPAAGELGTAGPNPGTAAPPEAVPPPALSGHSVYVFHEHLFASEALTYTGAEREVAGQWQSNRFSFPNLAAKADIRLLGSGGEGGIEFNPLPQATRKITFYDALPGGKIVFYYRVEQETQTKEINYMTLTVWAGRRQVKRLRLAASSKGTWQQETINLGVASFLNRAVPVTVDLKPDSSGLLLFKFLAEIRG